MRVLNNGFTAILVVGVNDGLMVTENRVKIIDMYV